MSADPGSGGAAPGAGLWRRANDALELWLYHLNLRNHWLFRCMEDVNELYARLVFRGVRRDAMRIDETIQGRDRSFRIRFLTPDDAPMLSALVARFDFRYLPPHPLDASAVLRALRRPSHLPFGLFRDGEPVGYCLVRLAAPRRCFTGVWTFPVPENAGLSRAAVRCTGRFVDAHGIEAYVTVPLDNTASRKGAEWAGWRVIRQNRLFYVLRRPLPPRRFPFARPERAAERAGRG
jgi:hypothetical protein